MSVIELKSLRKQYGRVIANEEVSLKVQAGTIHGIIGENGAGKSTAMKMVYGLITPDSGEIWIHGKLCHWRNPSDAMAAGIGMVHQHFMLSEPTTALDNILLTTEQKWFSRLPRAQAKKKLEDLSTRYGLQVDLDEKVENLSVGLQQRLEILKLLYRDTDIIILDEPTAVLTPQETQTFFEQLRKLRSEGKTILLITHKLKEVMAITDEVTILRAGRVVGHRKTAQTSPHELAELMIGRELEELFHRDPPAEAAAVLEVRDLRLEPRLHNVSFQLRAGEVLGIAGVDGNGQSELLQALTLSWTNGGPHGSLKLLGRDLIRGGEVLAHTADLRELGVGILPENRQKQGLLMNRPLFENFLLGFEKRYHARGWLNLKAVREATKEAIKRYDIRPKHIDLRVKKLSGGNQQKLVVARELQCQPRLILAAHPTRGVDIGAIEFIHSQLLAARDQGAAVLLVSSELDEIMELSDRILVFYRGSISGEFRRAEFDEMKLGLAMGGGV